MSGTTSRTSEFDTLSQANKDAIDNIMSLMNEETQLFASLQGMDKSPQEKQNIINRINQISALRGNLQSSLKDIYRYYLSNAAAAKTTIGQQIFAMQTIAAELTQAKKRLMQIEENKQSKLRLVQINTYYSKRYAAQKHMLQIAILVCFIVFIIALLKNRFGILPDNVAYFLMIITIAIGIIYLFNKFIDFSNRDPMNFDEYNWKFDKSLASTGKGQGGGQAWGPGIVCIGSQCCDQTSEYNQQLNKCIPRPSNAGSTRSTPASASTSTAVPSPINAITSSVSKTASDMNTGLSQFAFGTANAVTRLTGSDALPLEAKKDAFSNYASF